LKIIGRSLEDHCWIRVDCIRCSNTAVGSANAQSRFSINLMKAIASMVETGEGRTPRPEETIGRMYYKLVWLFNPRPFELLPTKPLRGQPVFLRPPLPASGGPHPRFMAPGLPDSGNTGEQTKPL